MKLILSALICLLSISAFAQQTPEGIGKEFVRGLSMQKDFNEMDIFFNENDFNLFFADLKANPKLKEEIKKSINAPKEIENFRKRFLEERSQLQQKWEQNLETLNKGNISVIFDKVETKIDNSDGINIYKIIIYYNLKKGDALYLNLVRVEGTMVSGQLKIAEVRSFKIELDEKDTE